MARITIASLNATIVTLTTQRDEALEALHRLRDEVLAARLAETQALYAQRPSRAALIHTPLNVERREYSDSYGRHFVKTRAVGTTTWTIREVR